MTTHPSHPHNVYNCNAGQIAGKVIEDISSFRSTQKILGVREKKMLIMHTFREQNKI